MSASFSLSGNIVDVVAERIFRGTLTVEDGKISSITAGKEGSGSFILPGLIDAHVHIESSLLVPSEFARLAVVHGTVGTVSDPHEIANVLGKRGVEFMLSNAAKVPFKICFGAPSCVPATSFETAGAVLSPEDVAELLKREEIGYLSEMMNFPGVLLSFPEVKAKIDAALKLKKKIDGHAPGLRGTEIERYIKEGMSTDHECFSIDEAREKIRDGMKVIIREGSAARNFDELIPLLKEYPDSMMFCSDDKHPDDLVAGHINKLVMRAIKFGVDPITVLRAATLNPVWHYGLTVGLLQTGDPADFIVVDNLRDFSVKATYIDGIKVSDNGQTLISRVPIEAVNNFKRKEVSTDNFRLPAQGSRMRVIEAEDGQLVTRESFYPIKSQNGFACSDPANDVLLLSVTNRYAEEPIALGFVRGFGLREGALASSVAHDSHNIVSVGATPEDMCRAVNLIIANRGGLSAVGPDGENILPLPVAGLMSTEDGYIAAKQYELIDKAAKALGSGLRAPFMTLSFMALLVIPELKLGDRGLFDAKNMSFVPVFV